MNYINTDSFGNSYLNGFSNELPTASFNSFNDSETGGIVNFFSTVYPSSQFWVSGEYQNFMLLSSKEGNTPSGVLSRFRFQSSICSLNTIYSGSESFVSHSSARGPLYNENVASSLYKTFCVCNNESISAFKVKSNLETNSYTGFTSIGWLDDPPTFTQNSPYRTSSVYVLFAQCASTANSNGNVTSAIRVGSEGGSAQAILTSGDANYAITCQSGGPPESTWATNLVLIDSAASPENYAMGSVRNVLLGKGTYTVGTVYKVAGVGYGEANTSPNTEQQHFLCVGTWGTDYLLMRVWTEGYQ